LKAGDKLLATGDVRVTDEPAAVEFVVRVRITTQLDLEAATVIREIGELPNQEFALDYPPEYCAEHDCWKLRFS